MTKLREILAPCFRDRLAQQWLITHIRPSIERRWIDDCFSNRIGKGTHGAISRLQRFMRMAGHSHYCQMDIRSFFPSINRHTLLKLWHTERGRLGFTEQAMRQIDHFLESHLQLRLHPDKTVLQRVVQGANFLGYIAFPHHSHVRERSLRALRKRMLATLNSYYGQLRHANTYHLRRNIYHMLRPPRFLATGVASPPPDSALPSAYWSPH